MTRLHSFAHSLVYLLQGHNDMSTPKTIEKVNLAEKFACFEDHWSPKIAGLVNDSSIKLVKLQGEFVWHQHEADDEMFLVVKGCMTMRLRDRDIELQAGEFIIIPRGVEHLPVAAEEAHIMLIEPKGLLNTGNIVNERTVAELQHI
jgi:mannose-6-phosphate isomerase-like protein (cupin superfamily)